MAKLLMISGDRGLAQGKRGAFYNTLEEFHKYWDRIDIIVPRADKTGIGEAKIINLFGNVFVHSSPWSLIWQSFWIYKKGSELHKAIGFDLMTVHEYPPFYNGIGARMLHSKTKIPYILEIHHIPGFPHSADLKESAYRRLMSWFIRYDTTKARAVRVVNQHETPGFLMSAGVPLSKIQYIPSMYIDFEVFKPWPVTKKYDLVFAGRLVKNKGIFNLLEAVKIMKTERPNILLLIIGNGPLHDEIETFINENNLQPNVHFAGWLEILEDVAKAYNSARLFVNPSFNEGGPRVAVEAMACGVATATTKVGLMHDIIQESQNGFFIDWEPKTMAQKLLACLADEKTLTDIAERGRESVTIPQFEKKSAIRNYAEAIKELIEKKKPQV